MIKAVLIDLDGTVFRGKTAIPGAERTIEKLRTKGIGIFFLTNASTKSRDKIVEKLKGMGLIAYKEEIFSSAYATADYIATNHPGKKVFCISEGGTQAELKGKGVEVVEDENADIVSVGLDRDFTYAKLASAYKAISKGALFIATNEDPTFPRENGFLPGAGSMVAAVQACTGKKPIIIGKPHRYGVELLLRENNLKREEVLVIGDRLETDIRTGKNNGITSILVLSGVAKKENLEKLKEEDKPDFIIDSINELPKLLDSKL